MHAEGTRSIHASITTVRLLLTTAQGKIKFKQFSKRKSIFRIVAEVPVKTFPLMYKLLM